MLTTVLFTASREAVLAAYFLLQGDGSEFKDLGKLLLGGFVLAVGAGVAFTVIRLRLRDKKAPTAQFLSISSPEQREK